MPRVVLEARRFAISFNIFPSFFLSSSTEHHERYYLYLIISVTIGVVLCLIIITGRIIINKNHEDAEDSSKDEPKFHKSNTGETTITKGFSGDNICDMEGGDIDLTTPMGMVGSLSAKNEVIFFFHDAKDTVRPLGNMIHSIIRYYIAILCT